MSRVKVAFVASGGAWRALAHLGVLKACEELGIHPEVYVGTGAGALVCAAYGQDLPLDMMLDGYRLPWRRRHAGPRLHLSTFLGGPRFRDFMDPGYLLSGLFSSDNLEKYLAAHLPINDFRQVPQPIFATAVDIGSGQRAVFGPGYDETTPISQAVAASCCIPGLFRPYKIGDRYYMDGEIVRTLSTDVAVGAGANVVIISNVYRPQERKPDERPIARSGALRVISQAMSILLAEKERRGVELYRKLFPNVVFLDIAPDIGALGYLNSFSARPLVMRGYKTALRVLSAAKEKGTFKSAPSPDLTLN